MQRLGEGVETSLGRKMELLRYVELGHEILRLVMQVSHTTWFMFELMRRRYAKTPSSLMYIECSRQCCFSGLVTRCH